MRLLYILIMLLAFSFESQASHWELESSEKDSKPKTCGGSFYKYMQDKAASLYYVTSVSGHESCLDSVFNFFKEEILKERKFQSNSFRADLKKSVTDHDKVLKKSAFKEEKNISIVEQFSEFKYCFKEENEEVIIVSFDNLRFTDFFKRNQVNPTTYRELLKEYNKLKANENNLNQSVLDFNSINIEKAKNVKKQQDHLPFEDGYGCFDTKRSDHEDLKEFFNHLYKKFEDKKIIFFTQSNNNEHFSYTKLEINKKTNTVKIRIIDSISAHIVPILDIVGSVKHEDRIKRIFQNVFEEMNLSCSFYYRGDQIINMQDCGRFATIYLLAELNGKNALKLSNYDIYKGFKSLQEKKYDEKYHREPTEFSLDPIKQSTISYFIGGFFRGASDFFLSHLQK